MTDKQLFKLAYEISAESNHSAGLVFGPARNLDGGERFYAVGRFRILSAPYHIQWMRLCPDATKNARMLAVSAPFLLEFEALQGYPIKPDLIRYGIRLAAGRRYSENVTVIPAGGLPGYNARLLLRAMETLKSRFVFVYKSGTAMRPVFTFADDEAAEDQVWSALLPVNMAEALGSCPGFYNMKTGENWTMDQVMEGYNKRYISKGGSTDGK